MQIPIRLGSRTFADLCRITERAAVCGNQESVSELNPSPAQAKLGWGTPFLVVS